MLCVMLCCVVCGCACGVCGVVLLVLLVVVVCLVYVWLWCVPRGVSHFSQSGSPKKPLDLSHFKFENRSNTACSRFLLSFALPDENCSTPASMKNIEENQSLHGSICLSPQEAECNERFARQYRHEPPLEILLTLPFSRCVHNLSGPNTCAHFQDHGKYTYTLLP